MINDQHKSFSHLHGFKNQSALTKRLIFQNGNAEKPGAAEEKVPEVKKESILHDVDFDKKYLDKRAIDFKGNMIITIDNLVDTIKDLDKEGKNTLSTDLVEGLRESVRKNLDKMELSTFTNDLLKKGLSEVRLNYRNATDTLEFQFFKKNGERITFPQKDISIQYVPRNLSKDVEYQQSRSTEAFGEKTVNNNKELKEMIPAPQKGDMIIVTRAGKYEDGHAKAGQWYETKIKCIYDTEKEAFVVPGTKQEIWIYPGNKVAYLPSNVEKAQPKLTLNVNGNELPVVAEYQLEKGISYSKLAEQILSENGGGIVQPEVAKIIQDTLISKTEYAALLKAAHEANGKTDRLPIVIPNTQAGRKTELRKSTEKKEFAKSPKHDQQARAEIQKLMGAALVDVRTSLNEKDQSDFNDHLSTFQQAYVEATTQEAKDELITDLVETLDDDFSSTGKKRAVNPDLINLLDNKKAWDTAWIEGTISGIDNLKAIVTNSPALKNFSTNKLRDTVFNILELGNNSTFDSVDVMKGLQLSFPTNDDLEKFNIDTYDELLGLAAMIPDRLDPPGFTDPTLNQAYQAALAIVQPVEAFSNALADLKISGKALASKFETGGKAIEANETDPEAKRNLAKLIQAAGLNLESELSHLDPERKTYTADVSLQGREAILEVVDPGWGKGWDVNVKDRRGKLITTSGETGDFDFQNHINKVRNAILSLPVKNEVDTRKLDNYDFGKQKYKLYSINQLEQLSGDLPGLSWKDYPSKIREKSIYQRTSNLLSAMGTLNSARLVDNPKNIKELNENDEVIININYKGQPLTLKLTNGVNYCDIALANGYNQSEFEDQFTIDTVSGSDIAMPENIKAIDEIVRKLPEYAQLDEAVSHEPSITVAKTTLDKFNEQVVNNKAQNLNEEQFLATIFQIYTFAELVELNLIRKIKGQENAYIITDLPESFLKDPANRSRLASLAFVAKNGANMNDLEYTQGAREKAREGLNSNKVYISRIAEIFGKSTTLTDTDGRRITMDEIDNTGAKSEYLEDLYFQTTSGEAANDRFLEKVLEPGTDKVNLEKANQNLNMLYQKGLLSLRRLAGTSEKKYQDLYEKLQSEPELAASSPTLSSQPTDFQKEIVRLGYLQEQQEVEVMQKGRIEKFREELAEEMGPELAKNAREKGAKVTDEEVEIALKELPISFLLGCQVNTLNETVTLAAATPIMLPINENFTFVITPGAGGIIDTSGGESHGGFFNLAVGLIGRTDLPGRVGERFTLIGGVQAGLVAGGRDGQAGVGLFAGIHGGVEFQFTDPRDPEVTTRVFTGLHGALGIGSGAQGLEWGGGFGLYFRWQDDVQAIFNRDMKEHFAERDLTTWIDQYNALTDAKPARAAFAEKLKADQRMSQYLAIDTEPKPDTETTIMLFERYLNETRYKFATEEFDPGLVLGGIAGIATHHLIAPPLWFIDFFAGLKINIGKDVVSNRKRKTSEDDMDDYGIVNRLDQLDEAFSSMEGTPTERKQQIEKSGKRFLDSTGQIRVSESETIGGMEKTTVGPNLTEYNQELAKAGLKLEQDAQGRIEVQVLPDITEGNTRLLIGPNIAVRENGKTYLKSPNALNSLYAHRFDKTYPFEVSHGATKLSVIILSDNRFYSHRDLPREIELTKFKGESAFTETLNKSQGTAEAYTDKQVNLAEYQNAAKEMDQVLSNGEINHKDNIRENFDTHYKPLYQFKDKQGQTFLSITNMDAKKSKEAPSEFNKETLYAFFDEYAESKKENPFNSAEKEQLFLELTEMRYVELARGNGEQAAYNERLNWAKNNVLIPFFKERIKELGPEITMTAEQLAQKAIDDIKHLSVSLPPDQLSPFTSAATALGRGADGLHMILKIGNAKEYGYVTGKDYTNALKTKSPDEDYQLALVLKSQIEALPEDLSNKENLDRFMRSSLAMKTASLDGLTLVLGLEKFNKVKDYYAGKEVSAADLQSFTDLIKSLEKARNNGELNYVHTNEKGQKYIFLVRQSLKAGVFQKCANYTITYNDDIAILPPEAEEAMKILASQGQALTTVERSTMLQFNSLFGGVIAGVNIAPEVKPPGGGGGKPEAPAEGEVDQEAGGPKEPPTREGTPQQPTEDVPNIEGGV